MPQLTDPTGAVYQLESDLWQTLIDAATSSPALTVEDELTALASVMHRLADQLRTGQATPASAGLDVEAVLAAAGGVPEPNQHAVVALTAAFKQVLAHASRCPACGRLPDDGCRCYVADRPDPYPLAIAAIFPLVAALSAAPAGRTS